MRARGFGGCTGDSGAPAFDGEGPLVIGVVSWSTGPEDTEGCGGLTGVTPLLLYRELDRGHRAQIQFADCAIIIQFSTPPVLVSARPVSLVLPLTGD